MHHWWGCRGYRLLGTTILYLRPPIPFLFTFLRTLLHFLHFRKRQLFYFHEIAHSLTKTPGWWGTPLLFSSRTIYESVSHRRVNVPTGISGHSKEKDYPPSDQNTSHPEFVPPDAELLRKETCTYRQQYVQTRQLRNAAQRRVRCGERVVGLSNPAGKFGEYLAMKNRKHRQDDQG